MKKITLLICALCVAFSYFAQDSIYYSVEQKFERQTYSVSVLPATSNSYLSIEETTDKKPQLIFKTYSKEGQILSDFAHEIPLVNDTKIEISHYHVLKDRILIFLTSYDKKQEKQYAFCITSTLNGESITQPALLHSIQQDFKTKFGTVLSPDSTVILAYFEQNVQKRTDRLIGLRALDIDLKLLWERELELPYDNDIVQVNQFKIDNTGGIYMLSGRNPQKNNSRVLRPQGGRYVVFYYNDASNKLKEFDISFKDKQVISALGTINKNNEMIVAGYYSNNYSFSAAGTFLFKISPHGESVATASYMAFPKEFLTSFLKNRVVEKFPEINDLFLDHLILTKEEKIILVGEIYYVSEQLNTDITTGRTIIQNVYRFENIVVTELEKDGKIIWAKEIDKAQSAISSTDRCGYNVYYNDCSLKIVFNDHPDNDKFIRNGDRHKIETWAGSRVGVISMVKLSEDGTSERKILTSSKLAGGLLIPALSSDVIHNQTLLGISQGKEYKFCLVD